MCDRILVFSTNPGRIVSEIKVDLPQPRDRLDPPFRELVERIYVEMTARPAGAPPRAATRALPRYRHRDDAAARVPVNLLSGLMRGARRRRPMAAPPTCR